MTTNRLKTTESESGPGQQMSRSSRFLMNLLSVLVIAFVFIMAVEKIHNHDIWWHLKTGQLILETGKIPAADPFTFTTPDAAWTPHYWLSDVLFAAVLHSTGLGGLILFKALVLGAAFFIIFRLLIRQGISPLLAVGAVLLSVYIGHFRFLLRPHVFMFLLSAAFFSVLSMAGGRRNAMLLWLLPLMLLWVNLHGSFFLGLVLTGCRVTEEWLKAAYRRFQKKDPSAKWPAFPMFVLFLLCAITLLNPFGIDLLRWIVTDFALKNVAYSFQVEEHMPLVWGQYPLFWGLMIATGASFALAFRKARLFNLLVFAATSFLAIKGVRFVALAAMLQAPILGCHFQALLEKTSAKKWHLAPGLQAAVALVFLLTGGPLVFKRCFADYTVHRFGLGINETLFPQAATRFLGELKPDGNLYNSWPIGGYLLWQLPDRKIFLDGRYLDAQLGLIEQLNTMSAEQLAALFDRFDIRAAILSRKDTRIASYFGQAKDFRLAYFDDQALVYLADDALAPEKMKGFAFMSLLHPEASDFSYLIEYARSPMAPKVEKELRHAATLAPDSFQTHFLLAFFLEAWGKDSEALEQYLLAVRANPRLAFVHYDLGRRGGKLAVRLRQWDQGAALLKEAIRFKDDGELFFLLATSLYQSGRNDEAEKAYLEVLSRNPQQLACLINLGYLYLDSGRLKKAEKMHRRALSASPDNEAALFGLALALQKRGKTAEAIHKWQEFLDKNPQSAWREKAKMHLEKLISLDPGSD